MLKRKEEKSRKVLLKKLLRLSKRELLDLKILQAMSSLYATFSLHGTIPSFTLLISLEEKLLQELLEE
jgi:hypothetical protein